MTTKLKEGIGRIGADCSGAFKPISGYDTTAQGYYDKCKTKGKIGQLQLKVCLVFQEFNSTRQNDTYWIILWNG